MINRENLPDLVAGKLGAAESILESSPATVEIPGEIPSQGFVALTDNYLVLLQESALGEPNVVSFPKDRVTFKGSSYGISGKTFVFESESGELKVGGIEMAFEKAVQSAFGQPSPAHAEPAQPPQPSATPPPQASPGTSPANYASPQTPYQNPSQKGGKGPVLAVVIIMATVIALAAVAYLFVSSMKDKTEDEPEIASTSADSSSGSEDYSSSVKAGRIVVLNSSGSEIIDIKKKDAEKYKVTVGGTTYKAKVSEDRIKIKTENGDTVLKVKVKEDGFKVYDGNDNTIIKVKTSNGAYKVKDDNVTLARIKKKGNRFVVTSDGGSEMGSAEPDGESWKVLDANGALLYTVHGAQGPAAAILPVIRNKALAQTGVLVFLNEF